MPDAKQEARLTEAEIRPDHLMAEQARRYQADVAWLLNRSGSFVPVPCPACTHSAGQVRWHKYGLRYIECSACGTVYVSPRPSPALLAEYYRSSQNYEYWTRVIFPASESARRSKIFAPRAQQLLHLLQRLGGRMGTLVDVGAGFGTFCEEVHRLGCFSRVIALEPEPHLAAKCRAKGLDVVELPFEDARFSDNEIDVITSFEVIEHLFAPATFIARCHQLLSPGGLLLLTCPNVRGFDIQVLGDQASAVDAEHLNYFHPRSLSALVERFGFTVLDLRTPGRLDAEIVRKLALTGSIDLTRQRFLYQILVEEWDRVGAAFQDFLSAAGLSSNMWLVARRQ